MMAARAAAWCVALACATEVNFIPGPGLRKNADGTFTRELTREYMEAAGALEPNGTVDMGALLGTSEPANASCAPPPA